MSRCRRHRIVWLLAPALLMGGESSQAASADDFIIIPGQRIGPLTLPATEADVMRVFSGHATPWDIHVDEGGLTRGTVLFRCDGAHAAELLYGDAAHGRTVSTIRIEKSTKTADAACRKQKPLPQWPGLQPGDRVSPDMAAWSRREKLESRSKLSENELQHLFDGPPAQVSAWHLANGVHVGMDVQDLQNANGRPFDILGPEGDAGNLVSDWHGGRLADCAWDVRFNGAVAAGDAGQTYRSDDAILRRSPSWVDALYVDASGSSGRTGCRPIRSGQK